MSSIQLGLVAIGGESSRAAGDQRRRRRRAVGAHRGSRSDHEAILAFEAAGSTQLEFLLQPMTIAALEAMAPAIELVRKH